ncbi:MAG: helix-turn-helix domain-containing protein [Haloplanus sp.]
MPSGIRATVEFASSDVCPITNLSAATGSTVDSVAMNVCPDDCAESVTEFSLEGDPDTDIDARITPVFAHGSTRRYRFVHGDGVTCPCECLGQFECPVTRYVAQDGTLTLVFHAADYDELKGIVAALRERFPAMDIKRFVRAPASDSAQDNVFVNRSKLTSRQLEVLETAYEMGYFERPRRANATEIASVLDITPATFSEHLAAAERKLLDDLL